MATEVIWTPQARQDVDAIRAYYLDIAPAFADIIVDKLLASTKRLETYPLSGRAVPEIEDEALREIIYREYRVIYYYGGVGEQVKVLTVLHTSQGFG